MFCAKIGWIWPIGSGEFEDFKIKSIYFVINSSLEKNPHNSWVPNIDQNLEPFDSFCDVSRWVKNSQVGSPPPKKNKTKNKKKHLF